MLGLHIGRQREDAMTGAKDRSNDPSSGPRRPRALPLSALRRRVKPSSLPFRVSSELEASDTIVGQERAVEAIDLAVGMTAPGYNVFALGPPGIGKMTALHQSLKREAAKRPVPDDWCYVHDFDDPQRPDALRLPPGRGVELREAMTQFILDLQVAIVALFEAKSYQARKAQLQAELEAEREAALTDLQARAAEKGIAVTSTPMGLAVAPVHEGKLLEPEAFNALPEHVRQRYKEGMERFGDELQALLREIPHSLRQLRRRVAELDREVTGVTVRRLIEEVRSRFADLPAVGGYLDDVEKDVVDRAQELRAAAAALADVGAPMRGSATTVAVGDAEGAAGSRAGLSSVGRERRPEPTVTPEASQEGPGVIPGLSSTPDPYLRYRVNVLVDLSLIHISEPTRQESRSRMPSSA